MLVQTNDNYEVAIEACLLKIVDEASTMGWYLSEKLVSLFYELLLNFKAQGFPGQVSGNIVRWSERIKNKVASMPIIVLDTDPGHKPFARKGRVVWRCFVHDYERSINSTAPVYVAADGKPAYNMYTIQFLRKKACCAIGQRERVRAIGWQRALDILADRRAMVQRTQS